MTFISINFRRKGSQSSHDESSGSNGASGNSLDIRDIISSPEALRFIATKFEQLQSTLENFVTIFNDHIRSCRCTSSMSRDSMTPSPSGSASEILRAMDGSHLPIKPIIDDIEDLRRLNTMIHVNNEEEICESSRIRQLYVCLKL